MNQSYSKKNPVTFAAAVSAVVRKIPRGKAFSYGKVADLSGFPGAARAVGTLMKKNFDSSIPCHRVVYADGRVGPYNRGGTSSKEGLLKQEGVIIREGRVRTGKK